MEAGWLFSFSVIVDSRAASVIGVPSSTYSNILAMCENRCIQSLLGSTGCFIFWVETWRRANPPEVYPVRNSRKFIKCNLWGNILYQFLYINLDLKKQIEVLLEVFRRNFSDAIFQTENKLISGT